MITSTIHKRTDSDGTIQNIQEVTLSSWDDLFFCRPQYTPDGFDQLVTLYKEYIAVRYGAFLGTMILFQIPDHFSLDIPSTQNKTQLFQNESKIAALFRSSISLHNGTLHFRDDLASRLFGMLNDSGNLAVIRGRLPKLQILPVSRQFGFLSKSPSCSLLVNSSFFTMTPLDVSTIFDSLETPIGLRIQNGIIESAPLFNREALLVDAKGVCTIHQVSVSEINTRIDDIVYRHNQNCYYYTRPFSTVTPYGGYDIVIIDNHIAAIHTGGHCPVPSAGFVIHTKKKPVFSEHPVVSFHGFPGIRFAIQAGNSAIVSGIPTTHFISRFHSIANPFMPAYPPTFYPLRFNKDRAPRIILGEKENHQPVLLWFEGAGKYGYETGMESRGVTLKEASEITASLGIHNGIHLDGGGSAQILLDGKRSLKLSDRDPLTFKEQERAVPIALGII